MDSKGKKTQEISGRIDQIRQYFCNGVNVDFAAKIGKDPTYTSQLCTGTKSIGNKIIEKILETFPEVSRAWLFLGEGEMLRNSNPNVPPSPERAFMGDETKEERTYNELTDEIAQLKRTLSQLQDYNDMIKAENKRLQKELEKKHNSTSELMSEDTI